MVREQKKQTRKKSVRGGGSVFLRADGRYEAKMKIQETGKYKSFYGKTEAEALKKLQEAQYEQKQGILATGPDQTVRQFLEYWFEDVHKPTVRISTYVTDRPLIYKHLIPGLGHFKLQQLTSQHLQSFYARKLREGYAAGHIRQMHSKLRKALTHAKVARLIGVNVADGLNLPKGEKHEAYILSSEQAWLLVQAARERDMDALIALAVITGMRKGEILGLRWSDIDLEKGTLQISRTLNYLPVYHFVEGKPKSETSERGILLPKVVIDLLNKHRALQSEKRLQMGEQWVDRNLVFPNKTGSFMQTTAAFKRRFDKLLSDAHLPMMHFHDLRHSAATILLGVGVPANTVQELLGHSDVATTLGIYGHVSTSMRKDVVAKLDGLYGQE